jgi:molecular chaperone GrpE
MDRPEAQQSGQNPGTPGREAEDVPGSDADLSRAPSEQSTRAEIDSAAEEVSRDLDALEETKRERDEYLELARRTKADFENYRKRVAGEVDGARRRGKADLAAELVPVLDNLERALIAAGIEPDAALAGDAPEGVLEAGVVLTYRELRATLARAGVEAYDPVGERFDPEWHEALSTRPAEGIEPGIVVDVMQKGYRLDGQLVRVARVVVSE